MKSIAIILSLFVSVSAFAAEGDTVIEGKSDYICTINFEDPGEQDSYGQSVFSGEVFTKGENSQIFFIKDKKVIKTVSKIESLNTEKDWKALDSSIFISVSLTEPTDGQKMLMIGTGRVDWTQKDNALPMTSMAGGFHKGLVVSISKQDQISTNCFHKSVMGL